MRSAKEIRFRIWQQLANVRLLALAPRLPRHEKIGDVPLPDWLPPGEPVERLANEILRHRFPLLGSTVETGPDIHWRRDYVHGRESGLSWFRLIPYLDFEKSGDHKNIWELNRHQHLVLLAQAFALTGRQEYVSEIESQLESWWAQNPFLKGINWASALEIAFRVLSWLWVDHIAGSALGQGNRQKLWNSLYQHGFYLQRNLSTYFSPNTHLLGEGVALYALGFKFPSTRWKSLGARIVEEELLRQIQPDGSHFERSTYYHVYALDFFLLYYVLAGRPANLAAPLARMAHFLAAVNGASGPLPLFGDDDGGRLFHPYGNRLEFGTRSLRLYEKETGTSLTTADSAALFPDSGLAAITRGDLHVLIDAGPFGPGGAGHSHSDSLSLTIRRGPAEILIDPGTYTYVADPKLRDLFRGSSFHNTVRVDGMDQADAVKPFRWENKPTVRVRKWETSGARVFLDAEYTSRQITHRRRYVLLSDTLLFIVDELTGPPREHLIEQFWHTGSAAVPVLFAATATPKREPAWRSRVLGQKEPSTVTVLRWKGELPQLCATAFLLSGEGPSGPLEVTRHGASIEIRLGEKHEVFEA